VSQGFGVFIETVFQYHRVEQRIQHGTQQMTTNEETHEGSTERPARRSVWPMVVFKSVILIGLLIGLLVLARRVSLSPLIAAIEGFVRDLGLWGPLVFGLVYVAAVVALVPASALTLAAGTLFGLVVGTVTVSLAATMGAALSFLIARYLARDAVARKLGGDPRFAALDRAIARSGWVIVALTRLSPAVPFALQNYLYGLTDIPFWTYVLTSWVAMLPGTLMYVYLGHIGRASLDAAAGAGGPTRTPGEWALLIVGLLATVAVAVFVGLLARRAMRPQAYGLKDPAIDKDPALRGL
jgi:uncharacterized membrane protein YdjX (TVP38/TMEM64 family)